MATAKKTSIARRTGTSAASRLARAQSSLRKLRADVVQSKVPSALMAAGLTIGGAALAGGLKGALDADEVMGVDTGVVGGLVAGTTGAALKQPWLIALGAGMAAPYVSDWVQDQVSDWRSGASTPLRAVGAQE